jgi:cell division protein FtsL
MDVRPLLVAIVIAAALALFYLSQSTRVAATGYEIDGLEATLAQRRAEQQQLIWAIGQARSPAEITDRARTELRLVPLEDGAVTFAPSAKQPTD